MRAQRADAAALCRRMHSESRAAVAVHEKPDLDAVGAAAGMLDLFVQLGVEAALHVDDDVLLPLAEAFLSPGQLIRGKPDAGVPLYALDCGSQARLALNLDGWEGEIVNIDHHADNTRFGALMLLDTDSSSTSEIVCDLARALDLMPGMRAASALYAGISFDTGHFRHTNTGARTFASAAWLVQAGVDVTAVYELLYEQRSAAALRLWGRAVEAALSVVGGRAMLAVLTRDDYAATGANDNDAEGIVESLRAVVGVEVAALIREQTSGARVRVSLRSDTLDVSAIAALRGGGGHRLAAGFSSDDGPGEVAAWLSSELAKRL